MEKVVETNLEKIKETAIAFLYLKPEFNKDYPFIVIPPFLLETIHILYRMGRGVMIFWIYQSKKI